MTHQLTTFSNLDRKARIEALSKTHFDIVIIGGGVTGAGIALDAALRGLKTILVEKNDFASGTSSKSTKLIHGGLRYLKQFEIGLVRESGLERSIAHNNACHLVHPEHMLLPIVKGGSFSKLTASIAISVYDWLAKVPKKDRKKTLSKNEVLQAEPLLKPEETKAGIVYSEYRTDDARLTLELIKDARSHSAEAFNYMEVRDYTYHKEKINGVVCHDILSDQEIRISGDIVVNATGPWVDGLRKKDDANSDTNLHLTKGVHIVLPKSKLPIKNATYFDAGDGRMLFAIPRGSVVYIGTTDTTYTGDKDTLVCTQEDANYLLNGINRYFNIAPILMEDIVSSWAGLRPLIRQKGKPPTEVSRKDEIFVSENGLISIAGGKLTGYRKMAERIVDLTFKKRNKNIVPTSTKHHKITPQPYKDYLSFTEHVDALYEKYSFTELDHDYFYDMASTFGKAAEDILSDANINQEDSKALIMKKILQSEMNFAMAYESVAYPMDFIERRMGWLYFDIGKARLYLDEIVDYFSETFSYSSEQKEAMHSECLISMDRHGMVDSNV